MSVSLVSTQPVCRARRRLTAFEGWAGGGGWRGEGSASCVFYWTLRELGEYSCFILYQYFDGLMIWFSKLCRIMDTVHIYVIALLPSRGLALTVVYVDVRCQGLSESPPLSLSLSLPRNITAEKRYGFAYVLVRFLCLAGGCVLGHSTSQAMVGPPSVLEAHVVYNLMGQMLVKRVGLCL